MSPDVLDTPESPPKAPVIPVGLATILGVVFAVLQFLAALVVFLFAPDEQKVGAFAPLATAALTLREVIAGRMSQAAAAFFNPTSPAADLPVERDEEFNTLPREED